MRLALLTLVVPALVVACGVGAPGVDDLIALAKEEQAAGRHRAAVIQLTNVLQKNREHAEALYLLGIEYHRAGDFRSAARLLQRALDLRYDPTRVVPPLCKSLLAMGDFQRALDQTQIDAGGDIRTQAQLVTLRGLASIGLGHTREGADLLARALEIQPELADALLGQARLAEAEGNFEAAARLLERAIAAAPRDIDAWMMKGDLQHYLKQDGALATYRKVVELDPENISARLNVVSIHLEASDLDAARQELAQAQALAPTDPMAKYMEGLIEFRGGNYLAAQAALQQALKDAPDHAPSILLAGMTAYALGSYATAQTHLIRAVKRAPANVDLRKLLALSFARGGNPRRALDELASVRAERPDDVGVLGLSGEFALQNGDPPMARDFFERAVKAAPASAAARIGLAQSRMAWGETDRALADLEAAVRLDRGNFQADVLLVLSHLQRKRFDQARKAATLLEQKQPVNPLTHNLMGAAYLGMGDVANARSAFERALEHQPTYTPAAINLAQLDLKDNNPRGARRRLEAVLEKDGNNVQALLTLAELSSAIRASAKEQTDWLERAVKAGPGMAQPKVMLARKLAQGGESRRALDLALQAQAVDPGSAEVLDLVGSLELAVGNSRNGLTAFEKLVALQPKSAVAQYRLGTAQAANGNNAGAANSFRQAIALQPGHVGAQSALASLELRAGRHPEAMQLARQLQKQAARSPIGYLLEGDVLMTEKKFAPAAKAYEAGYEIEKIGELAIRLHGAYTEAGKPDVAEARLAKWLMVAPDDVTARLYLADVRLKKGMHRDAIEQYEWLQRKVPESVTVLNNLAWAYHRVKDARALPTAERAYKLQPDNAAVIDTLGWILVEEGNASRGVELLQAAVAATPDAPERRWHLAQGWFRAGERSKARNELESLLRTTTPFAGRADAAALLNELRQRP
jgi:putative PEP-CTERM system TPR-repeat lipoprotein